MLVYVDLPENVSTDVKILEHSLDGQWYCYLAGGGGVSVYPVH